MQWDFLVLTAYNMKMIVLWAVVSCSLIEVNLRLNHETSDTSGYLNVTTRRYISEGSNLKEDT